MIKFSDITFDLIDLSRFFVVVEICAKLVKKSKLVF